MKIKPIKFNNNCFNITNNISKTINQDNKVGMIKSLDLLNRKIELSSCLETISIEKEIENIENISKKYSVDESGNITLSEANPILIEKMNKLKELCEKEDIYIKITEVVRSVERQDELYAKGRSIDGNIVTNAKGEDYSSMHQWGIAFDVCINEIDNAYDSEKLKRVGEIGKSIGLEWGGDWTTFQDMPHFQLPNYSIEDLKLEYGDPGNFSESW